jgi:hypothetical protein
MKKYMVHFENPSRKILRFITALLCLWILGDVTSVYAQDYRWLRVGKLQSPYNEVGAEYELEFNDLGTNGNYFSCPAEYGINQNVTRMKCLWIGCKNFYDPVQQTLNTVKVIGSGPRLAPEPGLIFPQEIKLIGKYPHPSVLVNNVPATILDQYDLLDEIDPDLPCDRMIVIRYNTSIGVSVTKKIMAFSNTENGNYFINDYVFKNTGIYNETGDVYSQTLDSTWFYFLYRYAFGGVSVIDGFSSSWGAFSSTWGSSTLNHSFGEDPGNPEFNMRGFYSWYGPHPGSRVPRGEDWGCPNMENGMLGSTNFAGCVTLHADSNPQDRTDDLFQPRTTWYISPDIEAFGTPGVGGLSDEELMLLRYLIMSEGHPDQQHDEAVGDQYPSDWIVPGRNSGGGVAMGQGYGPYKLEPGDSIHIVFAEGVSGISWEKACEVGANWLQWFNGTGMPTLFMPDSSLTIDFNGYKWAWVIDSGKDSILKTFENAVNNYNSGYNVPQSPPPPSEFNIISDTSNIKLSWSDNALSWSNFDGYVIYRAKNSILEHETIYEKIFECNLSTVVHEYVDVTAIQDSDYYYYIQSKDDGSANDVNPGVPLYSSKFYAMTSISSAPVTDVEEYRDIPAAFSLKQNYPNPFNPSTIISFGIPVKSFVSLKIFDLLGIEITTIVSEELPAGNYFKRWDGTNESGAQVTSGVYIYNLKVADRSVSGKMTLMK